METAEFQAEKKDEVMSALFEAFYLDQPKPSKNFITKTLGTYKSIISNDNFNFSDLQRLNFNYEKIKTAYIHVRAVARIKNLDFLSKLLKYEETDDFFYGSYTEINDDQASIKIRKINVYTRNPIDDAYDIELYGDFSVVIYLMKKLKITHV